MADEKVKRMSSRSDAHTRTVLEAYMTDKYGSLEPSKVPFFWLKFSWKRVLSKLANFPLPPRERGDLIIGTSTTL